MPTKKSSTPATKAAAKKAAPAAKKPAPTAAKQKAVATKAAPAKKAPAKPAAPAKKVAKKAGPLDKFLETQLKSLQDERANYTRQATALRAEADQLAQDRDPGDVQFDEESGQGDSMNVERERDLALSAQALAAVEEIDRAVEKIHRGTYGVCEKCHENIPKERLRALPYAALCVKCKTGGLSGR
jgi:DnaK suppressor protein